MPNEGSTFEFGRSMRPHFLLEDDYIPLNHGSYGTFPKVVREALQGYQNKIESNPDKFMRRDLESELHKARETVSKFINVEVNEIVFVQNTTTGINAILKSLKYEKGDKLLYLSTVYSSIRELLMFIQENNHENVELVEIEANYPLSEDDLIDKIVRVIQEENQKPNMRIKLAVIDSISSNPGVVFPFQRLIPILRQNDILSIVDGAHAIGQIPLDIKEINPDFFVTNCHKWLYTARSSAILYVPLKHQKKIHPTVTSPFTADGFIPEFSWTGTQDFSSYLTIHAALEFRKKIGGEEKIRNYCKKLAIEGGKKIASILGTEIIGPENVIQNMVNIRLPILVSNKEFSEKKFIDLMLNNYNFAVAIFEHNGHWYIRASAQIYTDIDDFEKVGHIVKEICDSF
ncbi:4213_t:CDS:2 [Funneliformis geosporum]|uniref:7387_t:CDS:1 n=1 Tax=Funneliformis geosporum TaxID=1117311 RepID=A0A9W4SFH1_9GLOM|nr:7387_t:CDS:2 [Funneliformis geosporum]CAI2174877.1 4213_t:CDS:2 [Funneliformis geosporum]